MQSLDSVLPLLNPATLSEPSVKILKQLQDKSLKNCPSVTPPGKKSRFSVKEIEEAALLSSLCSLSHADFANAESSLKIAHELRRSNSDTLFFFAIGHLLQAQTDKALPLIDESIWFNRFQLVPKSLAFVVKAKVHSAREEKPKAILAYEEAVKLGDIPLDDRRALSALYVDSGSRDKGVQLLRDSLTKTPDDAELKLILVRTLLKDAKRGVDNTRIEEAKTVSSQLLGDSKGQERYTKAVFPLFVRSLIEAGDLEGAQKEMQSALKAVPNNPELIALNQQLGVERTAAANAPSLTPKPESTPEKSSWSLW